MEVTKRSPRGDEITRSNQFWDIVEMSQLRALFYKENMTVEQMAKQIGRSHSSTEKKLAKMGLKRNEIARKYSDDFKRTVLAFYETTTGRETCEKFDLTENALEGMVRRARRLNKLPPVKIGERKNEWKMNEILELLRYLGLKPIAYIATRLDKTELAIESYLKRRGFRLHYVNGLRQDDFYKNFKLNGQVPFLRNLDGEVFLPWVILEDSLPLINADQIQIIVIKSMANFQRFLHGCKSNSEVITKLWDRLEE